MKEFKVFGITTKVSNYYRIGDEFNEMRSMDDYGDESLFISKKTYTHDCDEDLRFRYKYAIESYTSTEYGEEKTWYTLYLVPTYLSLSIDKQRSVMDCTSDRPDIIDVFDYGCRIVMAGECHDGGFDSNVVDDIANVAPVIDRLRGFYLDKCQNRIGTTGWEMLDDFIHNVDFVKATLDRFKEDAA